MSGLTWVSLGVSDRQSYRYAEAMPPTTTEEKRAHILNRHIHILHLQVLSDAKISSTLVLMYIL